MKKILAIFSTIALLAAKSHGSPGPEGQEADPRYQQTITQLTSYITNQMAEHGVVGLSIALVDGDQLVWAQGFGYADKENGIPATANTIYHIGSCSKTFAAIAALQLMEQGDIDLDVPITNYLPEFRMLPRFTNQEDISIHDLLDMHSGIPGDLFNGDLASAPCPQIAQQTLAYLANTYPSYPRDTIWIYSNSGYSMLELIIERLAHQSLQDYSQEHIFGPLNMTSSAYVYRPELAPRMAQCYYAGRRFPLEYLNTYAAGSISSTVTDMAQIIRCLLANGALPMSQNHLISSNTVSIMTAPQGMAILDVATNYCSGLGWDYVCDPALNYAGRLCSKSGGTLYHGTQLKLLLDQKLGVVVIQNTCGGRIVEGVANEALRLATLEKAHLHWPTNAYELPSSPETKLPPDRLASLTGIYVTEKGYSQVILATNGVLSLEVHNAGEAITNLDLTPLLNGRFSLGTPQIAQIEFTNIAGHALMISHTGGQLEPTAELYGERYEPRPLSAAWSNRLANIYLAIDSHPLSYEWDAFPFDTSVFTTDFSETNGLLVIADSLTVLDPQSDDLAFVYGVHNRGDSAVLVTGSGEAEVIQYNAHHFRRLTSMPEVQANTTNSTNLTANQTAWYHFTGDAGRTYNLKGANGCFVRIIGNNFRPAITSSVSGDLSWDCPSNGTYWVAIASTNAEIGVNFVLWDRGNSTTKGEK